MTISNGLDPFFLLSTDGEDASMKEELNGEVFISSQSRHFSFIDIMIKVFFFIFTLNWRVNNYVFRQGKGINSINESTIPQYNFVSFSTVLIFLKNVNCLL